MDIYSILSSKPHNPHYLNRYITFIEKCQQKNIGHEGYVERHHICPRAKDMFPEYEDFRLHPWNKAPLTPRQHFIAHLILWKAFPTIISTSIALKFMSDNKSRWGYFIYSKTYENLKISCLHSLSEYNRDKINVKSNDGKIIKIDRDEFEKGNYVAQHENSVMIRMENGTCIRISKEEFDNNPSIFGSTKGMTYAVDRDGVSYYVRNDDIRFSTGELFGNNAGKITITNGKNNKRILPGDIIPDGWYRGMTKPSLKNSIWINNGTVSRMVHDNYIPTGWVKGRVFNKKPKHVGTTGKIFITNGLENTMIFSNEKIPDGWRKGKVGKQR